MLTILKKEKFPRVYTIIFGEGILNDAIGIILFKVASKIGNLESQLKLLSLEGMLRIVIGFVQISMSSILMGLISGILFILFTRSLKIEKHKRSQLEISVLICLALLSYYLIEIINCSGIVTLFTFVVIAGGKNNKHLSEESISNIDIILDLLSSIAEAASFIYLGYESYNIFVAGSFFSSFVLAVLLMLGIGIIRWLAIGMPAFLFVCYENLQVEINELGLIWYAGLIRGSVSVALSISFSMSNEKLKHIVLMVSFLSSVILSLFSNKVSQKLGFVDEDESVYVNTSSPYKPSNFEEAELGSEGRKAIRNFP